MWFYSASYVYTMSFFQIQQIEERSDEVKSEVLSYQEKVTEKAASFFENLQSKVFKIEETSAAMTTMMKNANICEQIKSKRDFSQKLSSDIKAEINPFQLAAAPVLMCKINIFT